MIITKTFRLQQPDIIKAKVLNWLQQFNTFCFLDSNQYESKEKNHEILIGAGVRREFKSSESNALEELQKFIGQKKCWLFGHLAYGLQTFEHFKMEEKEDRLLFGDTCFFEPEIVINIKENEILITAKNPDEIVDQIEHTAPKTQKRNDKNFSINNKISRDEYISIIKKLQEHIHRGDCYEINFCQEFFTEDVTIDPFTLYENLNKISPNPFSALYRINDKWLICASPERFLQKKGNKIISQPIKGTLPRKTKSDEGLKDEQQQLLNSAKEKAENVMVVDLVRNDLSRVCKQGSVKVDELFGVYSFPQVHQMISTVGGELNADATFKDIINATFPMGSMTGAPKFRVMQLIDEYEKSHRGIFSGTVGYMNPDGDFDFNVVIRSIMYNQSTKYLSFQAGSGITIYADPEKEWEECLLKARAIKQVLS